jgi:hypothetical protein
MPTETVHLNEQMPAPTTIRFLKAQKVAAILFMAAFSSLVFAAELKPKTNEAFDRYVAATEARFPQDLRPGGPFLYIDRLSADEKRQAYQNLQHGELWIQNVESKSASIAPGGMVHHWVGIVFIPGATMDKTLAMVKDYGHRDQYYKPDVIAAKLLTHEGDNYTIFLRMRQKKFTTVIFNTNYAIHWGEVDAKHVYSHSVSTRVAEVKDTSKPDGEELPVGTGNGYIWRLNSYWRFQESDGGVYVQCEAVSLSRDIPTGLGWLLESMVKGLPKDSLMHVLTRTRDVVLETMHK